MKNGFIVSAFTVLAIALAPAVSLAEGTGMRFHGKEVLFSLLDSDDDGKLSYEEYQSAAKKFLKKRRAGYMERMDVDKDNSISLNEFKHWHENIMDSRKKGKGGNKEGDKKQGKHGRKNDPGKRLERFDLNKDGVIERVEAESVMAKMVDRIFEHKDRNKDGVITKDEMQPKGIDDRFAEHDLNKDGKLDQIEMDQIREERTKHRFEKDDKNNDGYIDINEFGQNRGKHGRRGGPREEGMHMKGMENNY
ncbi:MAG: hypothetical protein D6B28_11255 [Gammaproteobacteria bacterium]|nr:MAG: hypothetical protein D6B28_11255 [Gammaproteobacteria bacterium]